MSLEVDLCFGGVGTTQGLVLGCFLVGILWVYVFVFAFDFGFVISVTFVL